MIVLVKLEKISENVHRSHKPFAFRANIGIFRKDRESI